MDLTHMCCLLEDEPADIRPGHVPSHSVICAACRMNLPTIWTWRRACGWRST